MQAPRAIPRMSTAPKVVAAHGCKGIGAFGRLTTGRAPGAFSTDTTAIKTTS